jgi:hypothetical protein
MKKNQKSLLFSSLVVAATVAGVAAPAFAQEPATTAPPPEVRRVGRTSGDVGTGGLGIGATAFVSGLTGPQVVYDFGVWHLEGTLGFRSVPGGINGNGDRTNYFDFGVGGWYHLHIGENSDFSVGGRFGLLNVSPPGPANSATAFEFEPGVQMRAFITPNFAFHGGLALVFEFGDVAGQPDQPALDKSIALAANITSNLGFTYYFR